MSESSPRERLFRDDAGAALERVQHLEAENARLRREIAALKGLTPAKAPRALGIAVLAMLAGLVTLVGIFAVAWLVTAAGPPSPAASLHVRPTRPNGIREMSFESAKVWWGNHPELHVDGGVLSDGELTAPLTDGSFVRECGAPVAMDVTAKVAVIGGHAMGVSVYTTPRDPNVAMCVEERLRRLSWSTGANMGFVTKSY